ncbi:hypothetical protein HPB47_015896 [Ixodes persulcatus]|uniref:Uncharacterized protein n=1 Tax=Ixodes persulcatus TaxID=34615 RepID=A0AC60QUU6_IXOPE|nr:hypothetical protein HPB47_015896 [Ixodes persulcatus]
MHVVDGRGTRKLTKNHVIKETLQGTNFCNLLLHILLRNKAAHPEASTQSVADIDSDAGEGTKESLEPGCAWTGRGAGACDDSRSPYVAVTGRRSGETAVPRALDPFAFEQRRRAANAGSSRAHASP